MVGNFRKSHQSLNRFNVMQTLFAIRIVIFLCRSSFPKNDRCLFGQNLNSPEDKISTILLFREAIDRRLETDGISKAYPHAASLKKAMMDTRHREAKNREGQCSCQMTRNPLVDYSVACLSGLAQIRFRLRPPSCLRPLRKPPLVRPESHTNPD
jgi:hypothetical protein